MTPPILFFDGDCGLCDRSVQWVFARLRPESPLQFAPLQGATADRLLPPGLPDSVIVRDAEGQTHIQSAALRALRPHLISPYHVLLALVYPPLANPFYALIARHRKRLFRPRCQWQQLDPSRLLP